MGQDTDGDGIGEPVAEWNMPAEDMPEYEIVRGDDFSSEKLGLQWQWQANPNRENYSLTAAPGHLRLYCRRNPDRDNLLWYAPNVLDTDSAAKGVFHDCQIGTSWGEDRRFWRYRHGRSFLWVCRHLPGPEGPELRCYEGTVSDKMFQGEAEERCILKVPAEEQLPVVKSSLFPGIRHTVFPGLPTELFFRNWSRYLHSAGLPGREPSSVCGPARVKMRNRRDTVIMSMFCLNKM